MKKKHTALHQLPEGYGEFLKELKRRIKESQLKAAISANSELILLYWDIGKEILDRQDKEGWGAKVIERLAVDLKKEFPDMKGFSPRNLKYMRKFASLYPDFEFVQQAVAQIPWGHNVRLMELVKDAKQREWYIFKITEHGWSRDILVYQYRERSLSKAGKRSFQFFTDTSFAPIRPCPADAQRPLFF